MVPEITADFGIPLRPTAKYQRQRNYRRRSRERSQQPSAVPGLPLLHGFPSLPREVAVLLEFISKENAIMTRILQEVPQFIILSVTQKGKLV